jgi:hypothetical protein
MQKYQKLTVIGLIFANVLAGYLYLSIGPCSRPKIEMGYSNITDVIHKWEEVVEEIESAESVGISQRQVDSMKWIKRQTATVIIPHCMLPVKIELHNGMEARIRAFSAILEKASLSVELYSSYQSIPITGYSTSQVDVDGMQNQISEIEDKIVNLFITSETSMANFNSLFAKFANRLNIN